MGGGGGGQRQIRKGIGVVLIVLLVLGVSGNWKIFRTRQETKTKQDKSTQKHVKKNKKTRTIKSKQKI